MLRDPDNRDRVDLVDTPDFSLGKMLLRPALRQVEREGQQLTLEPRVMQVLVALAGSPGRVISRDELVERCWEGRIIGESAIQRVISRIRQLAVTIGGFELETITKVGYRLIVADAPYPVAAAVSVAEDFVGTGALASPSVVNWRVSRRILVGAAAIATLGATATAWRAASSDDRAARTAQMLVAKGREARLAGLPDQLQQSIAYLRRATELDPTSAAAWGALALSYQHAMETSDGADLEARADWASAAGRRALSLDSGDVEAKAALATIRPNFRNWASNEVTLRQLMRRHPDQSALEGALGWLLCDVGRWREAIACFRRALELEPFQPLPQIVLAWGLWGHGELAEAEQLLESAATLWPRHSLIWLSRYEFLAMTGSAGAAINLVNDVEGHPGAIPGYEPPRSDVLLAFAIAMQTRLAVDITKAADAMSEAYERRQLSSNSYVTYCCALGLDEQAFRCLNRYFFGSDRLALGPLSRRKTSILFSAKGAGLRRHHGYADLTRRLGLDDYWRITGTVPDVRTG